MMANKIANDKSSFDLLSKDMRILYVHDLDVGYDQALIENLHLEINSGEFIGLLGPNGSGKSTLVKSLLGLIPPLRGHAHIEVESSKIAYVPQRMKVNAAIPLTCGEFLHLKLHREVSADDIHEALNWVDLSDYASRSIHELSGGQIQRLFLAFAIINKPQLLILDEATEGMDVQALARFFAQLKDYIQKNDAALIFVSHDISAVTEHSNRVICLHHGVAFDGDPTTEDFHSCLHKIYGEKSLIHDHRH